jgi:hypothetical protein
MGAFVVGLPIYDSLFPSLIAALLGWQIPMVFPWSCPANARRFQGQLPEFIQLVAAPDGRRCFSRGSLTAVAQTESLVARWMRDVLQMSQGRVVFTSYKKKPRPPTCRI